MSLRTIETLTASTGTPLTIIEVTREEVSYENSEVELLALTDDGSTIKAVLKMANDSQKVLTLYEEPYYEPIQNFDDETIDAKILEILRAG